MSILKNFKADSLGVRISDSRDAMGQDAAAMAAPFLRRRTS